MKRDLEPSLIDREGDELADALDTMATSLGMDPALADANKIEVLSLYSFGLPDSDKNNQNSIVKDTLFLAHNLPQQYSRLSQGGVWGAI